MSASSTSTAVRDSSVKEITLTLLALAAAGVSSLLLVTATAGWAPMPVLFWAICVPGMATVTAILIYARRSGLHRLAHRLAHRLGIGIAAGIVLTLALDMVRIAGVHLGYLPDSVTMFGNLITAAPPSAAPTVASYTLGVVYDLFNGISFALVYTIVFGRSRWWGPVLYSVFPIWVGMMTLPPMAKMFGPFGATKFGTVFNGLAVDTLLAHLAMGIALGVIIQRYARHRGLLHHLLSLAT